MDPFTISTGVVGFLSLTIEISKILNTYVSDVKSAPKDAQILLTEVNALSHVLDQLVKFLQNEEVKGNSFDQTSVLYSVIIVGQTTLERLEKKLNRLQGEDKVAKVLERFKWPLSKDECQQTVQTLHRCAQTFEFSLTVSNWFVPRYSVLEIMLTITVLFFPTRQQRCCLS